MFIVPTARGTFRSLKAEAYDDREFSDCVSMATSELYADRSKHPEVSTITAQNLDCTLRLNARKGQVVFGGSLRDRGLAHVVEVVEN